MQVMDDILEEGVNTIFPALALNTFDNGMINTMQEGWIL